MSCQRNAICGVSGWVNVIQQQARGLFFSFCLFFFYRQSLFVTTVSCSFLKTSQGGSVGPQLDRERHLLRRPPEAGGKGAGASAKRVWEPQPNRVWCAPAAPAQLRCCGHRHITAKTSSVIMELRQCLVLSQLYLKRLDPLRKPVWWCKLGLVPWKYLFRCLILLVVRCPPPLRSYIFN